VTVKINIEDDNPKEKEDTLSIKITSSTEEVGVEIIEEDTVDFNLKLRSSLGGDLMILDHKFIDIVIQPSNKKVVTFAKDVMSDMVYGAESRLLEFLRSKGIIVYDSIQGGNVYGSLEGVLQESSELDVVKSTLLNIFEWMKTEQSLISGVTSYEEIQDDALIEPDNEFSTDLGEVPQEADKGSINTRTIFAPYLYGRFVY
jgi:hypothetical protein